MDKPLIFIATLVLLGALCTSFYDYETAKAVYSALVIFLCCVVILIEGNN